MFYEVIPGKIYGKNAGVLTYASDSSLLSGQIVAIPLGRSTTFGVVSKKVAQPDFPTKKITQVLCPTPLPEHLIATSHFIAKYYQVSLPSVLSLILPAGIITPGQLKKSTKTEHTRTKTPKTEQNRTISTSTPLKDDLSSSIKANPAHLIETSAPDLSQPTISTQKTEQIPQNPQNSLKIPKIPLNPAQKQALQALQNAPEATKLLFGLTGSGKTNIYLSEAYKALEQQKSVIILVPEIALTSQLVRVFTQTFGERVTLIHSKQRVTERRQTFYSLLDTTSGTTPTPDINPANTDFTTSSPSDTPATPKIVIGPRSALFAPLSNLGLIIIDEEHEPAYIQENAPRYSAIRVASFMARHLKISCILGSATPNLTDYHLAKQHHSLIPLTEKAKKSAKKPQIHLIDLKSRANFSKNRYFSDALIQAITKNLETGHQTLIFHNRRGSAPLTICESCGEELLCPNCLLPLTLHADKYQLVCHTCDYHTPVPVNCPTCKSPNLLHKGFGTKLLETELQKLFKNAKIRRFDADNKPSETLATNYETVLNGKVDILVGTQTLAKGLDLPRLTTVGVVQADAGLSLPDFSAEERTFQLLTQVIGRVGRGHQDKSEVFIQTFRPDHPLFTYAKNEDFTGFSAYALEKRQNSSFPPYFFVAQCQITQKTESLVIKKIRALSARLSKDANLLVSPPMPAFHEHTRRGYTWQLIVRARSRQHLLSALSDLDPNFRITFDPPSLL